MNIKSFIRTAVIAIFGILFFSVSSYAQFNMFGPGNYSPRKQGESAYEYGKRMAQEDIKRRKITELEAKIERLEFNLSCAWPENISDYTQEIRYYLTRQVNVGKSNMSLTAFPGKGEQGVSVRYRGNTPIGYCLIDENGKYADYWYFIGKVPSQDSWLCHYDGDDDVNAPYMYIKFSQDKQQINLLKSITSYFEIREIEMYQD